MLKIDERRAIDAIPAMLAKDPDLASRMRNTLHRIIEIAGLPSKEWRARLAEIEALLEKSKPREAPKAAALDNPRVDSPRPGRIPAGPSSKHS